MRVRGKSGHLLLLTTAFVTVVASIETAHAATLGSNGTAIGTQSASHWQISKLTVPAGTLGYDVLPAGALRFKTDARMGSAPTMFSGAIGGRSKLLKGGKMRYAVADGGISCVPFARAATGIELRGNATNWWEAADGRYERGSRPEAGSVLNFRSTGRMRLGHVAAVVAVVNSREVEIDHANWGGPENPKGHIARGISVVDVSEANDWSAVRVELGRSGEYGSVYPTYGFIYDRVDRGAMVANNLAGRGQAPRVSAYDEVAEAPDRGAIRDAAFIDAPTRGVR